MIGLALFGFLIAAGIFSYLELTEVESRNTIIFWSRLFSLPPAVISIFFFDFAARLL
jgi:hypothetical protein